MRCFRSHSIHIPSCVLRIGLNPNSQIIFQHLLALILQIIERSLMTTLFIQISHITVYIFEHFLKKICIIIIDTCFTKLLYFTWLSSMLTDLRRLFITSGIKVLISLSIDKIHNVMIFTLQTLTYTQPKWLLRIHELHNIWKSSFQQEIVFLFNKLLSA